MPVPFDEAHAAIYDTQFAKLAAMRDALHLVTQLALRELPEDAHILSVGAGTGAEILNLAKTFPGWTFTAVDTSAPMLERCRARVAEEHIEARVRFHVGDIHGLPRAPGSFDAATAILVSQFVVDPAARQQFFRSIADHLKPRAPLVFADLAAAVDDEPLRELWQRAQSFAAGRVDTRTDAEKKAAAQSAAKLVAIVPPEEVERLVQAAGFDAPTRVFQTLMIHGWVARRG